MPAEGGEPSFDQFDRRARAGERLTVVFFGASLTWGANATDPQQTSYRAQVARRLEEAYPLARWRFEDAAIGGTGSQLGAFRLQRDVLAKRPDLVFVDFSANDDIYSDRAETMASYEAIVRRIIVEGQAPVVVVILPFMWNVQAGSTEGMRRRQAHLAIAEAYGAPAADAVALGIERVRTGQTSLERLWPVDGVHPGDEGYAMFADAAWSAFQDAVRRKCVCAAPANMLHAATYMTTARVRLASLPALPRGWRPGRPNVVSAYFDMLMSRWLDDVVVASRPGGQARAQEAADALAAQVRPLRVRFRGQTVMLFGESTPASGKFRACIDGRPVLCPSDKNKPPAEFFDAGELARRLKGNTFLAPVLAEGLDPHVEHTLEIEPVFVDPADQELRIESVCIAGPGAGLVTDAPAKE